MSHIQPITESYWVEPGLLLAGEHPGHWEEVALRRRISRLLDAGVRLFIDLSEKGEVAQPYRPMLERVCRERALVAECVNRPLPPERVPERAEEIAEILGIIQAGLQRGQRVYVHCSDGVERTGMVMGCWLVERGFDPEDALDELSRRFMSMGKSQLYRGTPTHADRLEWVENWEPLLAIKAARSRAS